MWVWRTGMGDVNGLGKLGLEIRVHGRFYVGHPLYQFLGLEPLVFVQQGDARAVSGGIADSENMGQIAIELCQSGAQVIGGCCGTTPEHIAVMAESLNNQPC